MGNSCGTRERPVTHTPGDRGGAREGDVIERSASEKQREREREGKIVRNSDRACVGGRERERGKERERSGPGSID